MTASLFSVLALFRCTGRTFVAKQDTSGNDHVPVLSHAFWQTRFSGDKRITKADHRAQTSDILKLILVAGGRLVLLGAVFGLALAVILTRVLASLLFTWRRQARSRSLPGPYSWPRSHCSAAAYQRGVRCAPTPWWRSGTSRTAVHQATRERWTLIAAPSDSYPSSFNVSCAAWRSA